MVEAATELRQGHKAVLNGRKADLRAASKAHETALDAAVKGALEILADQGHPATDAARHAILTTLRALPADDPPGRLTRSLQPGGFEMLAGLSIASGKGSVRAKPEVVGKAAPPAAREPAPKPPKLDKRAAEAAAKAARELRSAEHAARREEFEAARTAREAEKAAKQLEAAREALESAQREFDAAEAAAEAAGRARDAAERRAREAERALQAAQKKV